MSQVTNVQSSGVGATFTVTRESQLGFEATCSRVSQMAQSFEFGDDFSTAPSLHGRVEDGLFMVPASEPRAEDYLANGSGQVSIAFHTQVRSEANDAFRTITLEKKGEDGEKVADEERQSRVTQKFVEIKSLLNLDSTISASYSVSWHFITLTYPDGTTESYDLANDADIKRLVGDYQDVTELREKLKEIQTTLQGKEYLGNVVRRFPTIAHDYMGNVEGPLPFLIPSREMMNTVESSKSHLDLDTMKSKKLVTGDAKRLTEEGVSAVTKMREVRVLQKIVTQHYHSEIKRKEARLKALQEGDEIDRESIQAEIRALTSAIQELHRGLVEFQNVNLFAIDHLIMHLSDGVLLSIDEAESDKERHDRVDVVAKDVAQGIESAIMSSNKPIVPLPLPFSLFQPHTTTSAEKNFGFVVGAQLYNLLSEEDSTDPVRLRQTSFFMENGIRNIPKMDRALDFLLFTVMHPDSQSVRQYGNDTAITKALNFFQERRENLVAIAPRPVSYKDGVSAIAKLSPSIVREIQRRSLGESTSAA